MSFEKYIENYDSFNKILVYDFRLNEGGIGDMLKFFSFTLKICIEHNIRLYFLCSNDYINKHLKLKYEKMYITDSYFNNHNNDTLYYIDMTSIKDRKSLIDYIINICPNTYYFVKVYFLYEMFRINGINELYEPLSDVFTFSNEVIDNANDIFNIIGNIGNIGNSNSSINKNYISIHLRLGDKFLEVDESFVVCKDDEREFNEENMFKFIQKNNDKTILFFCDNMRCKTYVKDMFDNIFTLDHDIGHTSFECTTEEQTLNTIIEFYILAKSSHIYKASNSGFSILASKFYNAPISDITDI